MELYSKKEQEKTAMVLALSTDETKWNKEIISEFLSQYPMLQNTPLNLTWKKKNSNKGYGVGSIAILGGAVPVVVKNFQAYPFDILIFPGRVMPLDKFTVKELLSTDNPFIGAADAKSKGSLSIFGDEEIQYSPNDSITGGGNNQTSFERPAVKVASFIDRISSFDYNDIRALLTSIENDSCTENEELSAQVEKIASKAVNYEMSWTELLDKVNFDRQYIFEDREGNSYVKQAFSGLDYSVVTPINAEEQERLVNKFAEIEKVASTDNKIEFVAYDEIKMGQEGQFVDKEGNTTPKITVLGFEKISELSDYVIIPLKDSNQSVVINNEAQYVVVDKKVPQARNLNSLWQFVNTKPQVGDKGFWVINGQATEFFTIDKIIPDLSAPGNFEIHGMKGGFDVIYKLIQTDMDDVKLVDGKLNTYWVPGNATFVSLKGKMYGPSDAIVKIINNSVTEGEYFKLSALRDLVPVEYIIKEAEKIEENIIPFNSFFGIEKEAEQIINDAPHLVYRDFGGFYHLFGPEFEKYASNDHEIHNLNANEVTWPLIHVGVAENKVEEVLKMYPGDEVKIAERIKAPYTINEFEKIAKESYLKNAALCEIPVLKDYIKIAIAQKDMGTIDAVLSLGLMNKFNIKEYLDLIPDYERVISELTRLLLYSRLTPMNFKPEVLEETVSSMNEVLVGLKGLREVMTYDKAALPSNL